VTPGPSIVWFRDDLRLADNPALHAGIARGAPLVLLYLLDDDSPEVRPLGAAARWWLHGSLSALAGDIAARGGTLLLRHGPADRELPRLVRETGAGAVFWNRRYGAGRRIDARLKSRFRDEGLPVQSFGAGHLIEPGTLLTEQGTPYRVFTPFWRAARQRPVRDPLPAPAEVRSVSGVGSDELGSWGLRPTAPDWAGGIRDAWEPGERAATRRLEGFLQNGLARYHRRDEPGAEATSRLSPSLRFGEIGPVQILHRVHGELAPAARRNAALFLAELGWREFMASALFHEPDLATVNHRRHFDAFPWNEPDPAELRAWQRGRTGIPLVDAGMRELWTTGHMHNRVRMITASFLVKNLLVDWRVGERWFWNTLVDADEASNPANWQWVAGSGTDAAPYFRVFNPEVQAKKFDPDGGYVRRWVPEAGTPGYPDPIVDLGQSRKDALAAYETMRRSPRSGAARRSP